MTPETITKVNLPRHKCDARFFSECCETFFWTELEICLSARLFIRLSLGGRMCLIWNSACFSHDTALLCPIRTTCYPATPSLNPSNFTAMQVNSSLLRYNTSSGIKRPIKDHVSQIIVNGDPVLRWGACFLAWSSPHHTSPYHTMPYKFPCKHYGGDRYQSYYGATPGRVWWGDNLANRHTFMVPYIYVPQIIGTPVLSSTACVFCKVRFDYDPLCGFEHSMQFKIKAVSLIRVMLDFPWLSTITSPCQSLLFGRVGTTP